MELDALKIANNQNAAMQGYQQVKVEQADSQPRRPVSRRPAPVDIDLPRASIPAKTERKPLKASVKTSDDTSTGISGNSQDDIDVLADRSSNEVLDRAIEQVNQKLAEFKSECQFNVHKQTGLVSIKIINSDTKELVKEIPPIKRLDAIAKMWELAGILIDEKR